MEPQKWEYWLLVMERQRKYADWKGGIEQILADAGEKGWELVSVTPRASDTGESFAGHTTDLLWVFKRPKA